MIQNGRFLLSLLVALVLWVLLVSVCYFWIDRPVAWFVHDRDLAAFDAAHGDFLKYITYVPPWAQSAAPTVLVLGMLWYFARPESHTARTISAASIVLLVAEDIKEQLKFALGRTWPDTWIDNNPSLIANDVYGFHPFTGGVAYSASPSGHTTLTVSVMGVLWVAYPRLRIVWVLLALTEAVALVSLNYHFVGDVVGGAFLGGICGVCAARVAKLGRERPQSLTA